MQQRIVSVDFPDTEKAVLPNIDWRLALNEIFLIEDQMSDKNHRLENSSQPEKGCLRGVSRLISG